MKKILIINGKKDFGHSKGALSQYLADLSQSHLLNKGFSIKTTIIDNGYNIDDEIQKWLWAGKLVDGTTLDSQKVY